MSRALFFAMPIHLLSRSSLAFPPVEEAEPSGLLAVGGDLGVARLVTAYEQGVFPWYSAGYPILWWSPSPRLILEPERLHVSSSLRRAMNKHPFRITLDQDFAGVIKGCAETLRPDEGGTWIVPDMIRAYRALHRAGFAHSVEAWSGRRLVGGLYGVSLGRVFFGESMFHRVPDSSKIAFVQLVRQLREWGFHFIDCQQTTRHLLRFGAFEVERGEFMARLRRALDWPTREGRWVFDGEAGEDQESPACSDAPVETGSRTDNAAACSPKRSS